MKLSKEDIKDLKEYDKLLTDIHNGKFVGAILSRKRKDLADVYERVTDDFCSTCNNRWIKRLSHWYIESKDYYEKLIKKENERKRKAKSKSKPKAKES